MQKSAPYTPPRKIVIDHAGIAESLLVFRRNPPLRCCALSRATLLLLAACALLSTGCVRRRLTVRTDPPGALIFVNEHEIGRSPVSVPIVYYGTRTIRAVKDGHEPAEVQRNLAPPWYQLPGIDFVTDNLWPYELRDEREVHIQLARQRSVSDQELLDRANNLRHSAQQGILTPTPVLPAGSEQLPPRGRPLQ